ncbi:MAG TPA: GNAT family protein [Acidimicrobiales bacterium]
MTPGVELRPSRPDDLDAIVELFREPAVAQWWPRYDRARIEREMIVGDDENTTVYVIDVDGAVAGVVQSWQEPDDEYRRAGMDIAVASKWHGTGVAVAALRAVARRLVEELGHHHLTIDPAASNGRAIACYRKLGYREVGVLRRNELGADGTFHDTLLMDLVADELVLEPPIAVITAT